MGLDRAIPPHGGPPPRDPPRPRTAFVLGGGGNLGAVQVGMLLGLFDHGVRPDVLVGCSVGALNAAAVAGDPSPTGARRLADIWRSLRNADLFEVGRLSGPWRLVRRGTSVCGNDRLRAVIQRSAGFDRFEEAVVPVQVVATSLTTGRERWFCTGPITDPILASAALPGVLPPVEIDGDVFVDGAVVDNVPIGRAVALGARRVVVLHCGNFERPRPRPRRPVDVLVQSLSIARNHRFLTESQTEPPAGVEVVTLPGFDPGPLRRHDFSRSSDLIERARVRTFAFLDARARAEVPLDRQVADRPTIRHTGPPATVALPGR